MATPPTPEELRRQLNELRQLASTLGKDFSQLNLSPVAQDAAVIENLLIAWKRELQDSLDSVEALSSSFQSIVQDITKGNIGINLTKKAFNSLTDISNKLKYNQEGINELNKQDLEKLQKKAQQNKKDLETARDILNQKKAQLLQDARNRNLTTSERLNIRKEFDRTNSALVEANALINNQNTSYNDLNIAINDAIVNQDKMNSLLGLGGAAVEGIQKALDKAGFGGLSKALGLDEVKKKMKETAEIIKNAGGNTNSFTNKFKILGSGIKEAGNQLMTSLKDPLVVTGFLVDEMIAALSKADKETGELAKAFGTSYSEATNLREELNVIANLSGDVHMTTSALQKSLIAVNKEFGTATMFSGELLKDFTHLTEAAGYTNEAASRLSKISVATGTDLSKNTEQILGQAVAFNATNKLALNEKEIVEEVAKASKATTLSLGMQPGALTKAVAQAKALGSSLEKVESISQSLLNFESSISSELEAELLTGRDLNLERARMYALNNDIEGVAREIAGQIGSAADFTKMNVIQQEALAKSVGMTREDLASSLIERQALSKIGEGDKTAAEAYNRLKKEGLSDDEIAAKLGDKKLADQLKSQTIQERFNASIEKLRDIFVSIAEPILQLISPIVDILTPALSVISGILGGIANIATYIGETFNGFGGVLLGLIPIMMNLSLITRSFALLGFKGAIAAIFKSFASIPFGLGIPLAVAAVAGLGALISSASSKIMPAGDMFSPSDGKTQVSTKEGGLFELSPNDDLIAAPGLKGKMNKSNMSSSSVSADMSRVEALLSQLVQKQDRPVQVSVEMDGEKVAKGVGNNSTKLGTSMSTNTYKIQ